jgi:large subunit ribosomal protein L10
MLKTEKEQIVAELVERLRAADTLIVADYRGLTHAELDGVRTELLGHGARFSVCKNTLTRIAANEAGAEALLEFLAGPTAIAFVHDGDMVAVAKTLNETARTTRRLELKGAVLQGRTVGADAVRELATLPPTEVLRGQVLGAIVAPLTSLLGLLGAPLTNLVGLIDARIEQLGGAAGAGPGVEAEAEGSAAEVEAEPDPEAASEPEADAEQEPVVEAGVEPAAEPETQPEETTNETSTPEEPAAEGEEQQ